MTSALVIVVLLLLPWFVNATTIILVRTDQSVYIGADSMRILSTVSEPRGRLLVCKIRRVGNTYVVASGPVEYPPTGFVLSELVDRAARSPGSLADKADALDGIALKPFTEVATHLRAHHPQFSHLYLDSYFIQVAFVGFEDGKPVVTMRKYMPKIAQDLLSLSVASCPSTECPPAVNIWLIGGGKVAWGRLASDPRFLLDRDTPDAIRELINLQIAATPDKAGPPISILRVQAMGARWIERGACPPI